MPRLHGLLPLLALAAPCGLAGFEPSAAWAAPAGTNVAATQPNTQPLDVLMQAGMAALDTDPTAAVKSFRTILERMPTHYGAAYQLANALDRSGDAAAALTQWQAVAKSADAIADTETAATARERAVDSGRAALMAEGIKAHYERQQPDQAAELFRRVLKEVPTHYGANFQLAKALDAAGKDKEAAPIWKWVFDAASKAGDSETRRAARIALSGAEMTTLMQEGVNARLAGQYPVAEERLRRVLVLLPDHYGAMYQLASTLDAAGRRSEGTALWLETQNLARSFGDTETLADATKRLAAKP